MLDVVIESLFLSGCILLLKDYGIEDDVANDNFKILVCSG